MTIPPDDLPRSPSGRIPQWVIDERAAATHRPYSGGMPPHLTPRQQRKWRKKNRPSKRSNKYRRRAAGGRITAILLILGLVVLGSYRLFSYPGGVSAAWDDLYATITADPLGTSTPEDGPPLAEPPTIENPSSAYEFWNVERVEDGAEVPTRWSSCEPIRYVINPKFGDDHFVDWVNFTVEEVSAATGLVFEYEGLTGKEPNPDEPFDLSETEEWDPVIIQFANEEQVSDLEGTVAGLALVRQIENTFTGTTRYVTGSIYLDETLLHEPAIDREPAFVHVLRHELGHLVGLGHVDDTSQIMYETPTVHAYQDGDLTGLSKLGEGPCR